MINAQVDAHAVVRQVPHRGVQRVLHTALERVEVAGLFDGFPRTEAQSEALDKLLRLKNTEIGVVLALEVSEEELVKRVEELEKIKLQSEHHIQRLTT